MNEKGEGKGGRVRGEWIGEGGGEKGKPREGDARERAREEGGQER